MMENGFPSPRSDAFPAGLRVLVVDDDPTWLKILEKMLKKCSYEVTTCGLARDALKLLRERKDGFDIVISDVYMPDMDGFKLLELVGLEMDLPVIMMSVDGETSRVMKGVQHGACDYLLKPIRMKELRNIWQHVFRKKIQEVRDIEVLEVVDGVQMIRNASDHLEDGHFLCGEDLISVRKRKDIDNNEKELGDSSSTKKARVVWSVDLHQKFVKAVHQIGFDKVGPKKILDLMNVPWLTRENVASHLQKYRLYLSRLQKENDLKISAAGIKHSESHAKEAAGNFGVQNSTNMQQIDVSNSNFLYSSNNLLGQNADPRSHESDRKRTISLPVEEPKRSSTVDTSNPRKPRNPQVELSHSLTSTNSELNYAAYDSTFSKRQTWSEIPEMQLKQEPKALQLDDGFRPLHLPGQKQHLMNDYLQPAPALCSAPTITERDVNKPVNFKPLYDDYQINVNHPSSTGSTLDSIVAQTKINPAIIRNVGPNYTVTSGMKNQGFNLSWFTDVESAQKNINWDASTLAALDGDLLDCWIQGDCYGTNLGLQNIEFSEYYDPVGTDAPIHLYDALRFDYENLCDPTEYSLTF